MTDDKFLNWLQDAFRRRIIKEYSVRRGGGGSLEAEVILENKKWVVPLDITPGGIGDT